MPGDCIDGRFPGRPNTGNATGADVILDGNDTGTGMGGITYVSVPNIRFIGIDNGPQSE